MKKIISFSSAFPLQPLSVKHNNFLPKKNKKNFFLSFSDSLKCIFQAYRISKEDCILMPNFYCPSTLNFINENLKIKFYKINNDFSIDKKNYFENIEKYKPKIILNYSFTGFTLNEKEKEKLKNLCDESTIIIEDYAHKILHNSDIKPINKNHFYIDSIRKYSPFTGCNLINENFNFDKKTVDRINLYKLKCHFLQHLTESLLFLSHIFSSVHIYNLSEKAFLKLDNIIGKHHRPTLGHSLDYFLHSHINLEKVANHRKKITKYYHKKLAEIDSAMTKNANMEMNYYPLFIAEKKQDEFIKYLHKNKIFAEKLWDISELDKSLVDDVNKDLYKSFIILPITYIIKEKDVDYICKNIKTFLTTQQ